jgi:hypothetical protein
MQARKNGQTEARSNGRTGSQELPSTLVRSDAKARRTWVAAHDAAVDTYGEGRRAHRVAFAALKHTYEKVGDHWEPKASGGPSDERAAGGGPDGDEPTAGGVNARASKAHLLQVARRLGVRGRSSMTKEELVTAVRRAGDRATAKAKAKARERS